MSLIVSVKKIAPTDFLGTHYSVTNLETGYEMITPYDYSAYDAAIAAVELVLSAQGIKADKVSYYGDTTSFDESLYMAS